MGVTPDYPKFGAKWGVVATKLKFLCISSIREKTMQDIDKIAMTRY